MYFQIEEPILAHCGLHLHHCGMPQCQVVMMLQSVVIMHKLEHMFLAFHVPVVQELVVHTCLQRSMPMCLDSIGVSLYPKHCLKHFFEYEPLTQKTC